MILFDIDNTLVYGRKAAAFYRQYSRVLEKTLAAALDIELAEAVAIANEYRAKYNGRGELAFQEYGIGLEIWHDAVCALDPAMYIEPMPVTNKIIKNLKNKKFVLGAITDGPRPQVGRIFQAATIDRNDFDFVIGWERSGRMPKYGSSEIFKNVCTEREIAPNETIMIGDSLSSDVLPALEAGLKAIHIGGQPTPGEQKFLILENIEAVTDIINNL